MAAALVRDCGDRQLGDLVFAQLLDVHAAMAGDGDRGRPIAGRFADREMDLVVDPPPTVTRASALRSCTILSAVSVTATGVCMTAPAKTPADRAPSEAAIPFA